MILSGTGIIIPVYIDTLLDRYGSSVGAYSLRNLRKGYTGSAVRVRRSNDNTEQDIGFTNTGRFDEKALTDFVGANSGFIVTWYDQSGSGRNATQATTANQPRIVNSGTVDKVNGEPAIRFDGSNDFLATTTSFSSSNITSCFVGNREATGANHFIYDNSNNSSWGGGYSFRYRTENDVRGWFQDATRSATTTTTYTATSQRLLSHLGRILSGTESNIVRVNNVEQATGTGLAFSRDAKTATRIGSSELFGGSYNGHMQELVVWAAYDTTNISAIETEINEYYGTY